MEITLKTDRGSFSCHLPYDGAQYVTASKHKCRVCDESNVQGIGQPTRGHDTYASVAACLCGERLGTIVVKMSTIFGLEEDEAVLYGRCRVY